jgi:hypothetical protein
MSQKNSASKDGVFCTTASHPFSPHPKRGWFHMPSHQINDRGFIHSKLGLNRLKGCSIFPSHFHDA